MTDDVDVGLHDLAMQADFNAEDAAMQLNLKQVRVKAETIAIKRALVCADNNSQAAK
ncbi:MAG: hypothetical protein ABGX71_01460 [Methyloprofundus sp.]|uniref:hypothetical protein n=1 Tax=Methyloprofundus sp. TaxID=2020875 RepID=UPI00262270FD|nr:hypothetical protein [Methyloprofundus sp.]